MKKMKRFLSIILAFTLIIGCCNVIPTFATTAQAETASEEWQLLGNNDELTWQTCSAELESQTIEFGKNITVKKLRLYVTGMFGSSYIIREFEALDQDGVNKACEGHTAKVTIASNLTNVNTSQLSYLCNGYGGETGYDGDWDQFKHTASSTTEYIEFEFAEAVELSAVRIWATWCNDPSWGNAPKSWEVMGLKEVIMDEDGFTLLGDNSSSASWADTPSNTFEAQEIVLDEPVWTDKIRLRVTEIYTTSGNDSYRISEFEVFDTNGVNVLASVLTDYQCDESKGQYATNSDGYKRSSLATVVYAEGMPSAKKDTDTTVKYSTPIAGDMIINGENMSNQDHWYDRTGAKENLATDYIEFQLDRPYEIATVKLWSNWCNGTNAWGCAPKKWQVWGRKTQQKIQNTLNNVAEWENEGFTFEEGKAIPTESGESKAYAGNDKMKEYRAETEVSVESGQMGVYTHVTDEGYYLAVIDKEQNKVLLYKEDKVVAEKYWPISGTVKLAITVNGEKISVWVDEVKMMDYTDNTPLTVGRYGLYGNCATGFFESIDITPIDIADILPADYAYEPTAEAIEGEMTEGDFYVSTMGDDNNSGVSIDEPFATIQKAQEAVKIAKERNPNKDYTVILRGGIYYLENTLSMESEDGGTGQYRVTYASYKDETAILSGGSKIASEWTEYTANDMDGVWVTKLPDSFKDIDIRQLFVEDSRATRSREPDVGDSGNGETQDGYWLISDVASDYTWVSPSGIMPDSWKSLANTGVEINFRNNWMYHRQEVTEFDTENNWVKAKNGSTGILGRRTLQVPVSVSLKDWMYFENALEFVDTENEWFYDEETNELYYKSEVGVNPNNLTMVVPRLDTLVDAVGTENAPVKNLDFYGIQFCHTKWYMPEDGARIGMQGGLYYVYDSDESTTAVTNMPEAAMNLKYAECINIQNCDFTMLGEGAIKAVQGVHSNRISGSTFTDVGGYGIFIGHPDLKSGLTHEQYDTEDVPRGNVILNNYLNYCGVVDKSCLGIWGTYLNHTQIKGNTVQNMTYTGVSVGWSWISVLYSSHHNQIENNVISNVMTQLHDGAGIYVLGSMYNSTMKNNYVTDTAGVNIYFDEGTRFMYCEGNYMSDYDIFYHMCSKDEMLANGKYVKTNYIGEEPTNLKDYGYSANEMGDVNYDETIDVRDVIRIKRYLAQKMMRIDKVASDVTGEGSVNKKDLIGLRKLLVEPKVVEETNHNGKTGYTQPANDYLTTDNFYSTNSAVASNVVKGICDNDYSYAYESNSPTLPEEFVFQFGSAITEQTTLRLVANYASDQGPSKLEVYVQKGTNEWEQIRNCNLVWDSTITNSGQCVEIPLNTTNITGIKIVVTAANQTWSKYVISEMDLFASDN